MAAERTTDGARPGEREAPAEHRPCACADCRLRDALLAPLVLLAERLGLPRASAFTVTGVIQYTNRKGSVQRIIDLTWDGVRLASMVSSAAASPTTHRLSWWPVLTLGGGHIGTGESRDTHVVSSGTWPSVHLDSAR